MTDLVFRSTDHTDHPPPGRLDRWMCECSKNPVSGQKAFPLHNVEEQNSSHQNVWLEVVRTIRDVAVPLAKLWPSQAHVLSKNRKFVLVLVRRTYAMMDIYSVHRALPR